jgi:ABC-type multidrug transport system ATPase subunit
MIYKIESLGDNSLVLIEEIENGLHPIATQRMVEYLMDVSKRKKLQAIFTTHSNDALMPLPSEAVWSTIDKKLYQGKLDVKSLRAMNGQVEASLAIFVEDEFAKIWVQAIISEDSDISEDEIEIHAMGGDGNAVSINEHNNLNPVTKYKSICIIDGDSQQIESVENKVYRLPGQSPERYVFDKVLEIIKNPNDSKIGELSVSLQKKYEDSDAILKKIKEVGITCRDSHLFFSQIGKKIGFVSETVVIGAFLHLWSRYYPDESQKILDIIKSNR